MSRDFVDCELSVCFSVPEFVLKYMYISLSRGPVHQDPVKFVDAHHD